MVRNFIFILLLPIQLFCKSNPDSLLTVDLQHKNLTKLPTNIEYYNIECLHLGYNSIKIIPDELKNAKYLRDLSINFNPILDLESSITIIKNLKLKSLSINNSNLLYLPLEIGEMKTLTDLSIANNYIKEIPAYIFVHTNFKSLNVSGNLISQLPKEIKTQTGLTDLNLSYNPCINKESTYQNLKNISELKQLEVKGAEELPKNIWQINSLEKIDISEGIFSSIVLPIIKEPSNIVHLNANDWNNLDFSTLLPILSVPTLQEIQLGGDKFNGFQNINLSNNISKITLHGNTLNNFKIANSLPLLKELSLRFNSITCQTELINSISKLTNLKTLNLSNCNLTNLPSQISNLKNIEYLNLSGNKIIAFNELYSLKQLLTLDVSFCDLTSSQIEKLKKQLPNTNIICSQSYEKLPLSNAVVKSEKFVISPLEEQIITTNNGTTIFIPKNSLIYDNEKPVKEPVTINYTPYYSLADIATSGINMNYKTSEEEAPFSSAGMFNINAQVGEKNIQLKKGAEIKLAFKSNDAERSYNYYAYDTINRSWKELGKDTITKIRVNKPIDSTVTKNDSIISNTSNTSMPQPPLFYANHDITIHWDVDKKDKYTGEFKIYSSLPTPKEKNDTSTYQTYFTEVKALSKITWKLDEEKSASKIKDFLKNNKLFNNNVTTKRLLVVINGRNKNHNSKTKPEKIIDFDLIADKEHDSFLFRFYDELDTVSFYAYPLIQNKNIDRTQKFIKKMYFSYESASKERKTLSKYRKEKFKAAYKGYKINMANARLFMNQNEMKNITDLLNSSVNTNAYSVTRVLQLQGFGIYNCDRPIIVENPIVFTPQFYDEKGKRISSASFQVIDPKENIVVSYYGTRPIRISKNSIITFMNTQYNTEKSNVYVGKLNTFDLPARSGMMKIQLSPLSNNITLGELSGYINSNN